jgi:hypothetical protein
MSTNCPTLRHYCCGKGGSCDNGRFLDLRCNRRHLTEKDLSCARLKGHDGEHEGYGFSVLHPKRWVA